MEVKILVATHKNYEMPAEKNLYLPVFVGKRINPNVKDTFQGDNTGNNISAKNPTFNELTALYWGWKNLNVDALGLVHYRRYLSMNHSKDVNKVLSEKQVTELLSKYDIILPSKRRYFIETNESHYAHAHYPEPLSVMREVIVEKYPKYLSSYDKVMKKTSAHMFNMFIMKKPALDEYCNWMFDILAEVEVRTDISDYDAYEKRVYGFLSELLLDVWLDLNTNYKYTEVNYVFMEHQNWLVKGGNFILRKLKGHF